MFLFSSCTVNYPPIVSLNSITNLVLAIHESGDTRLLKKKSSDANHADTPGKRLLEKAYLLQTADDSISYYNELADSYDRDFADGLGYALPRAVADKFHALATPADSPAVDIGCGTGLLGQALNVENIVADGMDISSAMLAKTRQRNIYHKLYEIDLTKDVSHFNNTYAAVLSSGTFTHGHLGPESLTSLLDIAQLNALFVIAVNQAHYESRGFNSTLDSLTNSRSIFALQTDPVGIYQKTGHDHSSDMGLIVSFRKGECTVTNTMIK